ncbi:hypothetical protein HYX70_01215 [Candidatus Saccharibacteria bacterium]|nr:hypothetical protein [Candidatus Saccharibacteria bacterium]
MKTVFAVAVLIFAGLLQVTVGSNLGNLWPNLSIILLVVLAVLLPLDSLLIPAILAGVLADYYSGSDFGLHMVYYLLVVLISKLVFKLGEKEPSVIVMILLAGGFSLLYGFIRVVGTQQFLLVSGWTSIALILLGRTVVAGALTWLLLPAIKFLYQLLGRWSHFYAR